LVSLSDQPRNGGLRILVEQIGILSKGNRPIAWLTEKQTGGIRFGKVLLLSEKPGERPVCFPGFPFPRCPQVPTFYGAVSYIQLSEADDREFLVWKDEASSFLLLCKSMHTDAAFLGPGASIACVLCEGQAILEFPQLLYSLSPPVRTDIFPERDLRLRQ